MKRTLTALGMASLLVIGVPAGADAQSDVRSDGWWDWAVPIVEMDRRTVDRRDDARRGNAQRGNARGARGNSARGNSARGNDRAGNGPPFCRNGQGHPVHGRRWCDAKGWSTNWYNARWDDAVLRIPRQRDRQIYRQDTLGDILGQVIFGRLAEQSRQIGAPGPLEGRWVSGAGGAQVLQVRAGGIPLAELTDRNGNGRVDLVLINRP